MDLMHAPTGSIMFVAVYWVTFATVMSPATASLIVAPVYLAPVREARLPLAFAPTDATRTERIAPEGVPKCIPPSSSCSCWKVTLKELALRMRYSGCGRKAAEVVAGARPRLRS